MTTQKSEIIEESNQVLRLTVEGDFNSFRIPINIKYQRSYSVPTKTTLIGLLGSALGIKNKDLEPYFDIIQTNASLISILGKTKDLWIVTKLKSSGHETAPIVREILVNPVYHIYYQGNGETLSKISDAFRDPKFALCLGRSDELIKIKKIQTVKLKKSERIGGFKNTIIPFNYRNSFLAYEDVKIEKSMTMELPEVLNIPVSFEFDSDGTRKIKETKEVTMVYDLGIKLKNLSGSWMDGQRNIFLY